MRRTRVTRSASVEAPLPASSSSSSDHHHHQQQQQATRRRVASKPVQLEATVEIPTPARQTQSAKEEEEEEEEEEEMAYQGSLKIKKKSELQEIASALNLSYDANLKRPELESLIRDELKSNSTAQSNPQFSGLWSSMSESHGTELALTTPGRGRRKSIANRDSHSPAVVIPNGTPLSAAAKKALVVIEKDAGQMVKFIEKGWLSSKLYGEQAKESVKHGVAKAQWGLSSSWVINLLAIFIELAFVIASTVPYTRKTELGPFKWLTYQFTPTYPWTLTFPDFLVLYNVNFIRSFLGWTVLTLLFPLLVSLFIVFPAPPTHGRGSSHKKPHPASPVTFAIIRFATAFYLGRLGLQGYASSWNWDIVSRFGEVQLVSAGTALAFGLYEATTHGKH